MRHVDISLCFEYDTRMASLSLKSKQSSFQTLKTKEVGRLFYLGLELAELAEKILESKGAYTKEFTRGLKSSLRESRLRQVKKIASLADL